MRPSTSTFISFLFLLYIFCSFIGQGDAHIIQCQTSGMNPNDTMVVSLLDVFGLDHSPRDVTVFRNCLGWTNCMECVAQGFDCGYCSVTEGNVYTHEVHLPSTNQSQFLLVSTTTLGPTFYEIDCIISDLFPRSQYELNNSTTCPLSTCSSTSSPGTEPAPACGACTNRPECSYCPRLGCVGSRTNLDDDCSSVSCCALAPTCSACTATPGCGWCNSKQCVGGNETGPFAPLSHGLTYCPRWNYPSSSNPNQVLCPYTPPQWYVSQSGLRLAAKVQNRKLTAWNGTGWEDHFWSGIDIGVTFPGMFPGELTQISYNQWFTLLALSAELGVDLIRVYTLLPPQFFEAINNFNTGRQPGERILYFLMGVWSPEEELIGDGNGNDAWNTTITQIFVNEVQTVVHAVHGNMEVPPSPGKASGKYTIDASPWLLGWIIGTEWFPQAVNITNTLHPEKTAAQTNPNNAYVFSKPQATPFEVWLAKILETAAVEQTKYCTQAPIAPTNWVSTDPLYHPLEPWQWEDQVQIDPLNIYATPSYEAGYFASIHAYAYYPDALRYQYGDCLNCWGNMTDPYAAYVRELKKYLWDIPLFISEFGLPTSRVTAHISPYDRNQGGLTEVEQAQKVADSLRILFEEGVDGGMVFALVDEWFKKCWNSMNMEDPDSRPFWRNSMAAEEHFGLISAEPGPDPSYRIELDGQKADWQFRSSLPTSNPPTTNQGPVKMDFADFGLSILHDESYVHLLFEKKSGNWDFPTDQLILGFDVAPGHGFTTGLKVGPSVGVVERVVDFQKLSSTNGVEWIVFINNRTNSQVYVNNWYDPFLYTFRIEGGFGYPSGTEADFTPYHAALSYTLEERGFTFDPVPFLYYNAGRMTFGDSKNGNSQDYNTLSDFYYQGNVLEIRLSWNLLGFMNPSNVSVWDYPTLEERQQNVHPLHRDLRPVPTSGITFQINYLRNQAVTGTYGPIFYTWKSWNSAIPYHFKKKLAFYSYQSEVADIRRREKSNPKCIARPLICKTFSRLSRYDLATILNIPMTIHLSFFDRLFPRLSQLYSLRNLTLFPPINAPTTDPPTASGHVITGAILSTSNWRNDAVYSSFDGVTQLRMNVYTDSRLGDILYTINGVVLVQPNQRATDAVWHQIDGYIPVTTRDLLTGLNSTTTFRNFQNLVTRSNWNWRTELTYSPSKTYTLFAPTDTALTSSMVNTLLNNLTLATTFVQCHIIQGTWYKAGLFDSSSLTSLASSPFSFTVQTTAPPSSTFTNSNKVVVIGGYARVTQADGSYTNGVIHVVDSVLDCTSTFPAPAPIVTSSPTPPPVSSSLGGCSITATTAPPATYTPRPTAAPTTAYPTPANNGNSTLVVVDSFSNAYLWNTNQNSLGGYTSVDQTCPTNLTSIGLTITTNPNCYFYTLFPGCFSTFFTSNLRIFYNPASSSSNSSALSFSIGLQSKDPNCTTLFATYTVESSSYPPTQVSPSLLSISIPLGDFFQFGVELGRLHGLLFSTITQDITLRRIEFLQPALPPWAGYSVVAVDGYNDPALRANSENNLGGVTSTDGTCTTEAWIPTGLYVGGGPLCYFYSDLNRCLRSFPQFTSASSLLTVYLSSPPASWSVDVGVEVKDSACSQITNTPFVSSSGYQVNTAGSYVSYFSVPFSDFAKAGATVSQISGLRFSNFSTGLTFTRLELWLK